MKLAIIGTGYVGLVTGTCFAEMGNDVVCIDIDEKKIKNLCLGNLPIYEPGLETLYERNLREGRLHFTTSLSDGVQESEVIFLALPTPPNEDGSADLSYVIGAVRQIAQILVRESSRKKNNYKILVNKSTVPVGTANRVRGILEDFNLVSGKDFDVVSNPEFLREGLAVDDFLRPERVVIGATSQKAILEMTSLYKPFMRNGNPILVMDPLSAEITKYAANAFLATKITFMNEVANLCECVGAHVDQVRLGIGSDSRIGKQFLYPGIGFGGSCFPKDVRALLNIAKQNNCEAKIVESVIQVNEEQRRRMIRRIVRHFEGVIEGLHFAVWGLAFKANTDDVRESSSIAIIKGLLEKGAKVSAFDPEANDTARKVLEYSIRYATDAYDALEGADALIIATEWNEFRKPDFAVVRQKLKRPLIFDGRNLYEPREMAELGFDYFSIGRPHYPGQEIQLQGRDSESHTGGLNDSEDRTLTEALMVK